MDVTHLIVVEEGSDIFRMSVWAVAAGDGVFEGRHFSICACLPEASVAGGRKEGSFLHDRARTKTLSSAPSSGLGSKSLSLGFPVVTGY